IALAAGALLLGLVAGPLLNGGSRGIQTANAAEGDPPEHTIAVSGQGKVTVIPDMATVSLGVIVERDTAKAARASAAAQMTRVVNAIKALAIAPADIATANVSLN